MAVKTYIKGTLLVPKEGKKWSNYHNLAELKEVATVYDKADQTDTYCRVKITKGTTYNKNNYSDYRTGQEIYVNLNHFELLSVSMGNRRKKVTKEFDVWF